MQPYEVFLRREFFSMSLQAATQHVKVYAAGTNEGDRQEIRDHLRDLLEVISAKYEVAVSESDHVKNIQGIVNTLSRRHSGLLNTRRFPFSSAQKALNLYLKYLWCLQLIEMPPHCPVDAIVLKAAKAKSVKAWTRIESKEEYLSAISELKAAAGEKGLAEWELHAYNSSDA